jgi:hypothetical protein
MTLHLNSIETSWEQRQAGSQLVYAAGNVKQVSTILYPMLVTHIVLIDYYPLSVHEISRFDILDNLVVAKNRREMYMPILSWIFLIIPDIKYKTSISGGRERLL